MRNPRLKKLSLEELWKYDFAIQGPRAEFDKVADPQTGFSEFALIAYIARPATATGTADTSAPPAAPPAEEK